jgi:alkanesulfonate monooxygenase
MQAEAVATGAAAGVSYASTVNVFSTAPQSDGLDETVYLARLAEVARWSEQAGCKGILIYTDNRLVDAWLVAQAVIQNTEALCPLVACQPVYMHPYAIAKMVSSFGYFYGRQVYLNMVAGGFRGDLLALGDDTPHDARYDRLLEYTTIVKQLLAGGPVSFTGRFYRVENLSLKPALPPGLFPGIFLSGSSDAGMAAARALGATAIEYPNPVEEYGMACERANAGIRIGIIADESEERAWEIAHDRFPGDRKGQLTHKLTMKVSDSAWHKQLSDLDRKLGSGKSRYWLWPFKNYKTFCPYLVGSHEQVAGELAKYIGAGFTNFILDIPAEEQDLRTAGTVFRMAAESSVPA